jgi:hypothetical protein
MPATGTVGRPVVAPTELTADVPLLPGVPTHIASVTVSAAGTYFVIGLFTVAQTTADVWLGSIAGASAGVYASGNSGNAAGVAALVKLQANSVVHLNCRATSTGRMVARPDLLDTRASQTSIGAVFVGP